MCSGDLGAGVSYLALIKIDGNLSQQALKDVHNQIKQLVEAQQGRIIAHARASTKDVRPNLELVPGIHGEGVVPPD